jgi:hypothetical protein
MSKFNFNEKRAVQAAVIFAKQAGNTIDKYKLSKMMYYLERQNIIITGQPLFFDNLYSAPLGPVASEVNHGIDTVVPPKQENYNREEINQINWEEFFKKTGKHKLTIVKDPGDDELSKYTITLIEEIHEKFKNFSWKKMQIFFHNLPEYKKTESRIPITYADILRAENFSELEIEAIESEINYYSQLTTA